MTDSAVCAAYKAVVEANLCAPVNPRCMGDCVCGHGFKNSVCTVAPEDNTKYCVCTDEQNPVAVTQSPVNDVVGIIG